MSHSALLLNESKCDSWKSESSGEEPSSTGDEVDTAFLFYFSHLPAKRPTKVSSRAPLRLISKKADEGTLVETWREENAGSEAAAFGRAWCKGCQENPAPVMLQPLPRREHMRSKRSFRAPALRESSVLCGGAWRPLKICHRNSTYRGREKALKSMKGAITASDDSVTANLLEGAVIVLQKRTDLFSKNAQGL